PGPSAAGSASAASENAPSLLFGRTPWKFSRLVDHVIRCARRSHHHSPTCAASSAERNAAKSARRSGGAALFASAACSFVGASFGRITRPLCIVPVEQRSPDHLA